jgi:carbonic anhydrase
VVPPFGPNGDAVGSAIEFAVLHLGVSEIVICGHSDCGGIMALEHPANAARQPHLARWLDLVRPAIAQAEVVGDSAEDKRLAIAKANVLLQRENLRTYDCVRDAEGARALVLHAWIYDLRTGDLVRFDDESRSWSMPVASQEQA